jgi:hypothetical protein
VRTLVDSRLPRRAAYLLLALPLGILSRLERDLHAGAQQRLVAVSMTLPAPAEEAATSGRNGRSSPGVRCSRCTPGSLRGATRVCSRQSRKPER